MKVSGLLRFSLRAGIVAPVLFVGCFMILGWLRPGYDPRMMYVSELSLGSYGWIQIMSFVVFGGLLVVFTSGALYKLKRKERVALIPLIGLCYILLGLFVMDPVATLPGQESFSGRAHSILAIIVFTLMPAHCLIFAKQVGRVFRQWSALAGVVVALTALLILLANQIPALWSVLGQWIGLIQRVSIITYMLWLFSFAVTISRKRRGEFFVR